MSDHHFSDTKADLEKSMSKALAKMEPRDRLVYHTGYGRPGPSIIAAARKVAFANGYILCQRASRSEEMYRSFEYLIVKTANPVKGPW